MKFNWSSICLPGNSTDETELVTWTIKQKVSHVMYTSFLSSTIPWNLSKFIIILLPTHKPFPMNHSIIIPVFNYVPKNNNRNSRKRCEICLKLTIKTPEQRQWHLSLVFSIKVEYIRYLFLMLLLLTLTLFKDQNILFKTKSFLRKGNQKAVKNADTDTYDKDFNWSLHI